MKIAVDVLREFQKMKGLRFRLLADQKKRHTRYIGCGETMQIA